MHYPYPNKLSNYILRLYERTVHTVKNQRKIDNIFNDMLVIGDLVASKFCFGIILWKIEKQKS